MPARPLTPAPPFGQIRQDEASDAAVLVDLQSDTSVCDGTLDPDDQAEEACYSDEKLNTNQEIADVEEYDANKQCEEEEEPVTPDDIATISRCCREVAWLFMEDRYPYCNAPNVAITERGEKLLGRLFMSCRGDKARMLQAAKHLPTAYSELGRAEPKVTTKRVVAKAMERLSWG